VECAGERWPWECVRSRKIGGCAECGVPNTNPYMHACERSIDRSSACQRPSSSMVGWSRGRLGWAGGGRRAACSDAGGCKRGRTPHTEQTTRVVEMVRVDEGRARRSWLRACPKGVSGGDGRSNERSSVRSMLVMRARRRPVAHVIPSRLSCACSVVRSRRSSSYWRWLCRVACEFTVVAGIERAKFKNSNCRPNSPRGKEHSTGRQRESSIVVQCMSIAQRRRVDRTE
jgi:hypothetical protein